MNLKWLFRFVEAVITLVLLLHIAKLCLPNPTQGDLDPSTVADTGAGMVDERALAPVLE